MKRLGVLFILFLTVIALMLHLKKYFIFEANDGSGGPSGRGAQVVIKEFPFKDRGDLGEWQEKLMADGGTGYAFAELMGKTCVKADSKGGASALYYRQSLPSKDNPVVSWDWFVEEFPSNSGVESLSDKKLFDFAGQFYVVFYAKSFLNIKAIQYIWSKDIPPGRTADSPYTKNIKILVLESGPGGEWKRETRDIRKDYKELFGEELEKDIMGVGFMAASDSTSSSAVAYYTNIFIGAKPPVPPQKKQVKVLKPKIIYPEWMKKIVFWRTKKGGNDQIL